MTTAIIATEKRIHEWRLCSSEDMQNLFGEFLINPLKMSVDFSQPAVLQGVIDGENTIIAVKMIEKVGGFSLEAFRQQTGIKHPDLYRVTATSGNIYFFVAPASPSF